MASVGLFATSQRPAGPSGPEPRWQSTCFAIVAASLFLGLALSSGGFSHGNNPVDGAQLTCAASTGSICDQVPALGAATVRHDLTITSVNVTVMRGSPIAFYATLPSGVSSTNFTWFLGDGTSVGTTSGIETHTYPNVGTYAVFAKANDSSGVIHDNLHQILMVGVTASFASDIYGSQVQLRGAVVSNSTSSVRPTALIVPGGSVTIASTVITGPENSLSAYGTPAFVLGSFASLHAKFSGITLHAGGTSIATVTFNSSTPFGLYPVRYADPTLTPVNGSTMTTWSNYTFTVAVGAGLRGAPLPVTVSPHPGVLVADEAGGSASSFDPAFDYDSRGGEYITNVYQTLIYANGTLDGPYSGDFNPGLAVCVPGSPQCTAQFGTSLIAGSNGFFTFVINPSARFYDNATGQSFGVYPSDVMFSVARLLSYIEYPGIGFNPGYLLAQALLPNGTPSWDGSLHFPFNNTPSRILDSMYVNNTNYCPASALTLDHGCITFVTQAGGHRWPFFLAIVGAPVGNAVEPCGWFSNTAQGAALPLWTTPSGGMGDVSCLLPGGATTTSSAAFQNAVAAMAPTAWDTYQLAAGNITGPVPGVQWRSVGSGPYYGAQISTSGFELRPNPAFASNPHCTWPSCEPTAGTRYTSVKVHWVAPGPTSFADLAAGRADFALAENASNTPQLDNLIAAGAAAYYDTPTLTTQSVNLNLEYNVSLARTDYGRTFTAPPLLLLNLNFRQFLATSYPSTYVEYGQGLSGGVSAFYETGGVIPQHLGNYYPANISWSLSKPDTNPADVGGAAWWWARAAANASVAAACTVPHPCSFPVAYALGSGDNIGYLAWASWISTISGGTVRAVPEGVSFFSLIVQNYFAIPGQNPAVAWKLGWVTDYSDPSDITGPFYGPSYFPFSSYTVPDALLQALNPLNASGCSTAIAYWSSLATPIPHGCQGAAYDAMLSAGRVAFSHPLDSTRVLLYNEIEHVAKALGLYPAQGQTTYIRVFAPWVSSSSLSEDPLTASWAINLWFDVRALAVAPSTLSIRGVVAEPNPVGIGSLVVLYALATGGTGGYSYSWSGILFGCAPSAGATLTCLTNKTGTFNVQVTATDATGSAVTSVAVAVVVTDYPRRPSLSRARNRPPN